MFFSIFSSGGRFVQRSGCTIVNGNLVEGHPKNISVKSFLNRPIGLGDVVQLFYFLIFALVAILFSRAKPF